MVMWSTGMVSGMSNKLTFSDNEVESHKNEVVIHREPLKENWASFKCNHAFKGVTNTDHGCDSCCTVAPPEISVKQDTDMKPTM